MKLSNYTYKDLIELAEKEAIGRVTLTKDYIVGYVGEYLYEENQVHLPEKLSDSGEKVIYYPKNSELILKFNKYISRNTHKWATEISVQYNDEVYKDTILSEYMDEELELI